MESYNLFFKTSAKKELRSISKPHLEKILSKIESLSRNPRPHGIQMLRGNERYYRLRQSDYRIIYEVDNVDRIITIIKIGHRREVYE